jgi:hypothetical protein
MTEVDELTSPLRQILEGGLGMNPSDAMQIVRVFVLVEGEHDVAVINGTIGDELEEARARLVALRGTHQAVHLAESWFLVDFTNARILICL